MGILLLSCAEKVVNKPEHLIPKDTMVDMLHDLALISAAASSFPQTLSTYDTEPMAFLYQKYETDSAQFVQSHVYYASLPLEYQAMYKAVAQKLDQSKETVEATSTEQHTKSP